MVTWHLHNRDIEWLFLERSLVLDHSTQKCLRKSTSLTIYCGCKP
jgi:hypothetical protein